MPCGARLEVVQKTVERETDVESSDHVDVDARMLPILPRESQHGMLCEELVRRGWERQPEGSLTKVFGDAVATLPAGGDSVRIAVQDAATVRVSTTETARVAEGDTAARDEVARRAEARTASKLAAAEDRARAALIEDNASRLWRVLGDVQSEVREAVNETTKRALRQRAAELGAIDGVVEGQGSDGYELTITVKT